MSGPGALRRLVARYTMLENVTLAGVSHFNCNCITRRSRYWTYVDVTRLVARHIATASFCHFVLTPCESMDHP